MGTIEDLIFRIPLERSQFSTLFLNVAQSNEHCKAKRERSILPLRRPMPVICVLEHGTALML
jgi:hypothetical protein